MIWVGLLVLATGYILFKAIDGARDKILGRLEQLDEAILRLENALGDLPYGGRENRLKAELGDAYLAPDDREPGAWDSTEKDQP